MGRASWDERFMRIAFRLAERAAERGDVPVGALVVVEGRIAGWGSNTRQSEDAILGHAEIAALDAATRSLGDWRLPRRSSIYVTLEPCVMCAGALLQARVSRIVYGCRDPKAGALRSLYALAEDPRTAHRAEVIEGVLASESSELLEKFFAQLRDRQKS